jgi:hypothetical protein
MPGKKMERVDERERKTAGLGGSVASTDPVSP